MWSLRFQVGNHFCQNIQTYNANVAKVVLRDFPGNLWKIWFSLCRVSGFFPQNELTRNRWLFGSCPEKSAPRSCVSLANAVQGEEKPPDLWMMTDSPRVRLWLELCQINPFQKIVLLMEEIGEPTNMNESLSIMGYWINRIKPIVFWYDCMTESDQKWWHDDVTKLIWRFFCAYKGNTRLDFTFFQDFYT